MNMKPVLLLKEFATSGHPLGQPLPLHELDQLIDALKVTAGPTSSSFDLSPGSLTSLSRWLIVHSKIRHDLPPAETGLLVRRLAAYVGQVLMLHTQAEWREGRTLLDTQVIVRGRWTIVKDRIRHASTLTFMIGLEAALGWQKILLGEVYDFYWMYHDTTRRVVREKVS
jgi:hypothetical protein